MKLIIDIEDNLYDAIQTEFYINGMRSGKTLLQQLITAIRNGIPLDDFLKQRKEPVDKDVLKSYLAEENLCESCTNVSCEFQSGIKRSSCAFYLPPRLESELKGENK